MIDVIVERKLFPELGDDLYHSIVSQCNLIASRFKPEMPSLDKIVVFDTLYGSYVALGLFSAMPTRSERVSLATLCKELAQFDTLMTRVNKSSVKMYCPMAVLGMNWAGGNGLESMVSRSSEIRAHYTESFYFKKEYKIVEVLVERKLYANSTEQEYIDLSSLLYNFAASYVPEIPCLEKVLVLDSEHGKYIFLGMFSQKPSNDEIELFSDLCSEMSGYDSDMTGVTDENGVKMSADKCYFPGGICDISALMPNPMASFEEITDYFGNSPSRLAGKEIQENLE